jgi:hypothetical protein
MKNETHGFCWVDSRFDLYQFEDTSDLIKNVIDNSQLLSKHFFDNSRRYNTQFQITSFEANKIVSLLFYWLLTLHV